MELLLDFLFAHMFVNLINLLPREYGRALRREYIFRLITVCFYAASVVTLVTGVFLLPSFFYTSQEVKTYNASLEQYSHGSLTEEEKQVNATLQSLAERASVLSQLTSSPTASTVIREVMGAPRSDVAITHILYNAPTPKNPMSTIQVVGTASTREALQKYNTTLGQLPSVTGSDLPISNFAQASNIPFTITLSGTFTSP